LPERLRAMLHPDGEAGSVPHALIWH